MNYDLVGLGTGLYGFTGPPVIRDFVKDLRLVGGKHIFVFSTHATYGELFFPDIVPRIQSRGMVVIGTYDCYAPCYGASFPDPYPTEGHPDEIDLQEAREFGKRMVENSLKITDGDTSLIPPVPTTDNLDFYLPFDLSQAPPPDMPAMPQGDPILYHQEKCNYPKCQLCMDNCPCDGIELTVTPPVIANPCIHCAEMCAKVCPTGAMEVNTDQLEASVKLHRDSLSFLYYPALEAAEKNGHFRRLIPVEKVGEDTPFYMNHPGHPQWIVGKGPVLSFPSSGSIFIPDISCIPKDFFCERSHEMEVGDIFLEGKHRKRVQVRNLFCYWAVRELGISLTELARRLEMSIDRVGYSVERGEVIVRNNHYQLIN